MKNTTQKGFTLIEIMTAVSVFLVVMTISMGAIISIFDANRKAQSAKTVMDNLNFAVETMSREIRFGTKYHCGSSGNIETPQNCLSGDSFISFLSSDNLQTVYRLSGSSIQKSVNGGSDYIAVTAPEISITSLTFYVVGATGAPDTLQPKTLIKISGNAGTKTNTRTAFTLQTMASQRLIDN
jgi:prepilin-type N-terminal cleavage/methylation domain-containing protein